MAADMIELECPSCSELLELDIGFAGGVCRCSGCGTLMTVPAKGGRGHAEALTRPDRPDAPGGTAVSRRPESPGDAPPGRPEAPAPIAADRPPASAQTYVTTTGRVVTLDAHIHIPTAGKRKRAGVRIATIVAFCTLIAVVFAACIVAIITLTKASTESYDPNDSTQQALQLFFHDPAANPLQIEHPNVLGLPMSKKTAVVLDIPGVADSVRAAIHRMLAAGLNHPDVELSVAVIGADAAKPMTFGEGMTALKSMDTGQLATFLAGLKPAPGQFAAAITQALSTSPDQLILITDQKPRSGDMGPITDALDAQPSLIVDAVMINTASNDLENLVRSRNGTYTGLSSMRMEGWIDQAPQQP